MVSAQELLAAADADPEIGEVVSERKIARWRADGLLPRARVTGLGRGKGVRSEFPLETVAQLRAIGRLHPKAGKSAELRLLLWLEGYEVSIGHARRDLAEYFRGLLGRVSGEGAIWEKAEEMALQAARYKARSPRMQALRRRVGSRSNMLSVLTGMFELALGGKPALTERDWATGDKSLGALMEDGHGISTLRSQIGGEPGAELEMLARKGLISLPQLAKAITEASDEELERAREDLQGFRVFAGLIPFVERVMGEFGFSALAPLAEDDLAALAGFCAILLTLRGAGYGSQIDELVRAGRAAASQLFAALPEGMSVEQATAAVEAAAMQRER